MAPSREWNTALDREKMTDASFIMESPSHVDDYILNEFQVMLSCYFQILGYPTLPGISRGSLLEPKAKHPILSAFPSARASLEKRFNNIQNVVNSFLELRLF